MNHERLAQNIGMLRHFINNSLGLNPDIHDITGFHLNEPLLDAAAHNSYIETISNKSDTLYLRSKEALCEMTTYSYLDYIRRISRKFVWNERNVMLAFDYTDEDFYGEVQGFEIHGWKKSSAISGKFKFLTCSIVSDEIPEKIPLISVPIYLGHYKSQVINHCISLIKPYIGKIELILFDRGFYDKDLMYELGQLKYPYLIFVPKHKDKQEILYSMEEGDAFTVVWDYELNKDKTKYRYEGCLTFMKQIYDKRTDTNYDWVFATNVIDIELDTLIKTYKKRWRIETGYRVQDEARIRCKSKDMKIRYFLFMYQQMLQTQWVCFFKDEVSFKKFVIEMHETCKKLVANPGKRYGQTQKL